MACFSILRYDGVSSPRQMAYGHVHLRVDATIGEIYPLCDRSGFELAVTGYAVDS